MKKCTLLFLSIWLFSIAMFGSMADVKGSLVIVGVLDVSDRQIFEKYIELGGGADKIRIAIIPAANDEPADSGRYWAENFIRYGVAADHIKVFPIALLDDPTTPDVDESKWAKNGFSPELAQEIQGYSAVFFVGGDQIRNTQTMKGANGEDSPVLQAIRKIYADGGVIGGHSAGAALMSDPMICEGESMKALLNGATYKPLACPEPTGVSMSTGLGFFTAGLVDQHFLKRGRIGRLVAALYAQPKVWLGVGVDENTAAVVQQGTIEVVGNSGVLIIDASEAKMARTSGGLKADGLILHYLEQGDRFNLETKKPEIFAERKKVEKGKEEFETYPLETNILGPDACRRLLIDGLADNSQESAEGLSFLLETRGRGKGSRWMFRKSPETVASYKEIAGHDTYSLTYIQLQIRPIAIRFK